MERKLDRQVNFVLVRHIQDCHWNREDRQINTANSLSASRVVRTDRCPLDTHNTPRGVDHL